MAYDIKTTSGDYEIDLHLRGNRTVISGDSGSGKTFLFNLLQQSKIAKNIVFVNYERVR